MGGRRRGWLGYGLATLLALAALGADLALFGLGTHLAGPAFLVAVVLSAWWGGRGPALLATAIGALALDLLFETPQYVLMVQQPGTVRDIMVFVAAALAVSWAETRLRAERDRSEAARAELAAILEAVDDAVTVYDPAGRLVFANPGARERFMALTGRVPASLGEVRASLDALGPRRAAPGELAAVRALRGAAANEMLVAAPPGRPARLYQSRATPVRDAAGRVRAVVEVTRDVTEVRDAASASARLEGALKTAYRVALELNNALALTVGYAQLFAEELDGEAAEHARLIQDGAERAAAVVARLQRIVRFEEVDLGGPGPMLDLDAATAPTTLSHAPGRAAAYANGGPVARAPR